MKSKKWRIGNHQQLATFFEYACELVKEKPFVIVVQSVKRSLDQNALFHAVAAQIAAQKEDETLSSIRCELKLNYAVPILLRDDEEYARVYNLAVAPHFYEDQLKIMRHWPATRLMNMTQMGECITDIIRDYSQEGIIITNPRDSSYGQYPEAA